ncbi:MAG: hypothetical protein H6668_05435 [Ardenticatenaceae bacterium]|nr:hypothetical protein [Ardenticatenaceae bacterium]
MSEKASVTLKAFLIHAATDPKLQQLLASLNGEQLIAYLVSSGLSEADARLYAAARESYAGKQAFADALSKQQSEGWVMSAEGWVMSPEGWVMSAEGWVMSAEGWVMSPDATSPEEAWVMTTDEADDAWVMASEE